MKYTGEVPMVEAAEIDQGSVPDKAISQAWELKMPKPYM